MPRLRGALIGFVMACNIVTVAQQLAAPMAVNGNGQPWPQLVTVCTTNPGSGTCGTTVTTYTSISLATACSGTNVALNNSGAASVGSGCSNPGYADNNGNVVVYAGTAGSYWCQFSGSGIIPYSRPCPGGGSSGGSGTVSANSGTAGAVANYAAAGGSTTVGPDANLVDNGTVWINKEQLTWATGLGGSLNHILGPSDQALQIAAATAKALILNSNNGNNAWEILTSPGHFVPFADNSQGVGVAGNVPSYILSYTYKTQANCSSSAAPAVCGSAAAGSVVIAAAATTVTVDTTAVTANSQIFLQTDDTLGTKLSVTCNSTLATLVGGVTVTARSAGTSFQITSGTTPGTNPLCISYWIVN